MGILEIAQRARMRDKEMIAAQESKKKSSKKLMSFKQIMAKRHQLGTATNSKPDRRKLRESVNSFSDINQSLFAVVPARASDREMTLAALINELRAMTDTMDIYLTVIGIDPEVSSTR